MNDIDHHRPLREALERARTTELRNERTVEYAKQQLNVYDQFETAVKADYAVPVERSTPEPARAVQAIKADIDATDTEIEGLERDLQKAREHKQNLRRELTASLEQIDAFTAEMRKNYLTSSKPASVKGLEKSTVRPASRSEGPIRYAEPPCHPTALWVWNDKVDPPVIVCSVCGIPAETQPENPNAQTPDRGKFSENAESPSPSSLDPSGPGRGGSTASGFRPDRPRSPLQPDK